MLLSCRIMEGSGVSLTFSMPARIRQVAWPLRGMEIMWQNVPIIHIFVTLHVIKEIQLDFFNYDR